MNPRSQTLIRIPRDRKGRYTKAARDQGRTLADWVIRELDRASGYQSPTGQPMKTKLLQRTGSIGALSNNRYRVFFYQEAASGFDRGQQVKMGENDFALRDEAQAALDNWLNFK